MYIVNLLTLCYDFIIHYNYYILFIYLFSFEVYYDKN